jgi:acetyltransferase
LPAEGQVPGSLEALYNPDSIAVVGASSDLRRIGGRPLDFLRKLGYDGRVYPVNPRYDSLHGWRCYPSIEVVPEPVDLAIVALPAEVVLPVLEACARRGVKAALVLSAGFAETGTDGLAVQRRLAELARDTGLRICGPNCIGLLNAHRGIGATFSTALDEQTVEAGSVGFVSQSGALGAYYFALGQQAGLRFSGWMTTGNEVDVSLPECVEHFVDDPRTRVVVGWAEAIRDGARLRRAAEAARQAGKPFLLLKAGRSSSGRQAAASHTAALATDDRVVDGVCRQHGIIRADSLEALGDATLACLSRRLPAGRGVGIVGLSGGAGVMLADDCARHGLHVPELAPDRVERLRGLLPWYASPRNPVDCTAQIINDPRLFRASLAELAADRAVDSVVVFMGLQPNIAERVANDTVAVSQTVDKPFFVTWMVTPEPARRILGAADIPVYEDPSRCIAGLAALVRHAEARRQAPRPLETSAGPRSPLLEALRRAVEQTGEVYRSEPQTKALLRAYGIPTTRERLVQSIGQALAAAAEIGYPVVLKLAAARLVHKATLGAVRVDLRRPDEVEQAAAELLKLLSERPELEPEGVLVQELIGDGVEVLLGLHTDPAFGPLVTLGSGGPRAELEADVAVRLPPLLAGDLEAMLDELKLGRLLRGRQVGLDGLRAALLALGRLAEGLADLELELDLNPLFVRPGGQVLAGDAALVVRRSARLAGRAAPSRDA